MKRLFLISFVALLLFTSCDDSKLTHTDLVVRFACEKYTMQERSLLPTPEAMTIAQYKIFGNGPNGETVEVTGSTSTVTLGQLLMGKWSLTAQALNSSGAILAQGTLDTMLSSATSTATINLTELVGEGTLSVAYSWRLDQVASDVRLELSLTNQQGEVVALSAPTVNKVTGTASISASLPSGSYMLCSKLYSQDVLVSGSAEAVRIIPGTTTTGSLEMKMGDRSTIFTMTVINDTMMPIGGTVACTPTSPTVGSSVTLTFTPSNLQGVATEDLTATWYCEGALVVGNGFSYTSVPKAGSHRYDVIVSHAKLGSLGSTTILVNMPIK
jgi:hypothetical protein